MRSVGMHPINAVTHEDGADLSRLGLPRACFCYVLCEGSCVRSSCKLVRCAPTPPLLCHVVDTSTMYFPAVHDHVSKKIHFPELKFPPPTSNVKTRFPHHHRWCHFYVRSDVYREATLVLSLAVPNSGFAGDVTGDFTAMSPPDITLTSPHSLRCGM